MYMDTDDQLVLRLRITNHLLSDICCKTIWHIMQTVQL